MLADATYPDDEVVGERERLVAELGIARSQPSVLAREALLLRLHGGHPYGTELPEPDDLAAVEAGALRALHARIDQPGQSGAHPRRRSRPGGGARHGRRGARRLERRRRRPRSRRSRRIRVGGADDRRPARVRCRPTSGFGGPALPRSDPRFAAQQVANVIFGGYFSSRLVSNIREDKGYTYSPRSGVEHALRTSRLVVSADAATEVTAPALLEILYELGRISVLKVERRRARGGPPVRDGVARAVDVHLQRAGVDAVGPGRVRASARSTSREHPAALARVTAEDVLAVAASVLAPARLVPVLLGDRERSNRSSRPSPRWTARRRCSTEAEATRSA